MRCYFLSVLSFHFPNKASKMVGCLGGKWRLEVTFHFLILIWNQSNTPSISWRLNMKSLILPLYCFQHWHYTLNPEREFEIIYLFTAAWIWNSVWSGYVIVGNGFQHFHGQLKSHQTCAPFNFHSGMIKWFSQILIETEKIQLLKPRKPKTLIIVHFNLGGKITIFVQFFAFVYEGGEGGCGAGGMQSKWVEKLILV